MEHNPSAPPLDEEAPAVHRTDGLVEMTPMDSNGVPIDSKDFSSSLPTPEEHNFVQSGSSRSLAKAHNGRRKWYLLAALVVVVLIISVSVGTTAGRGRDRGSTTGSSTSNSDNSPPTGSRPSPDGPAPRPPSPSPPTPAAPTAPVEITTAQLVNWMATRGVSERSAMLADGTPQNSAAQFVAADQDTALPTTDKEAYLLTTKYVMATLFYAMGGKNWTTPVNFLANKDVCEWNDLSLGISGSDAGLELGGLVCDSDTGLPLILDLELNNLAGEVPTELGLLTSLQLIDMEYNNVAGTLPEELCGLTDLKHLWFRVNDMTGSIPDCFGSKFTNLMSLNLQDNDIDGTLPESFCQMTSLESIVLDRCGVVGPMPDCIDAWSNMVILSIADNLMTGEIPTQLATLTGLQELYLDGNSLEGNPLNTVNGITELDLLYLEENEFTGILRSTSLSNLKKARAIDLSENSFSISGTLPTEILTLPELHILDLSANNFAGSIPDTIQPGQDTLVFFSMHENQMTGNIPLSLTNLGGLQHLDLANNKLVGPVPDELFQQEKILHVFLSENPGLTAGPLPDLTAYTKLREISLKNTNRNGPLPELVGFTNLFLLDLDDNDLTGTIPTNYGTLPALRHLLLNSNPGLTGDLPAFTTTGNLGTVLLDGTGVKGNFNTICELPTFTGDQEIPTEVIMIADCSDADSGITCDCCHCCSAGDEDCSNPLVASLDWTWEYGFQRNARDFAINATRLQRPSLTTTAE